MKYFKKGQVVPRNLGIIHAGLRGAQHQIVFGADCTWDGRVLKSTDLKGSDCMIRVKHWQLSRPRKNGTRQKCRFQYSVRGWLERDYCEESDTSQVSIITRPAEQKP